MTIRPLFTTTVAAVFTLALYAAPARAQSSNQFHFLLGGGLSIPTSDLGDNVDNGYNLVVGIGAHQPGQAFGLRAEGFFNQFNTSTTNGFTTTQKTQIGGITGNATYDFNMGGMSGGRRGRARNSSDNGGLYAIGGLGWYQSKVVDDLGEEASENHLGWNIGGGYRIPLSGFSAYVEARYNSTNLNGGFTAAFIPITVGLVF